MTTTTIQVLARPAHKLATGRAGGILFFLLAAFAVPLGLYQAAESGVNVDVTVVVLQEIIIVYASVRLAAVVVAGSRHPMQLGFWLFVYVWLGLAGLLQEAAGTNPFLFLQSPADRTTGALIVLVGLIAYDAGNWLAHWRGQHATGLGDRVVSLSRTRIVAVVGLAALPLLIPKLGGISALFSSREAVSESLNSQGAASSDSLAAVGIYTALATVPMLLALLILLRSRSPHSLDKILLVVVVVANVFVNNPISNPRFWFGTICFALLYTSPRLRRPTLWRWLPVALLLLLIVGFPYADRYRYSVQSSPVGVIDALTIKGDYDANAQVANAVAFVDANGHTDGHQIEGALLFWLPRSVWPDKAIDTGTLIGQFINFQNLNLSCPLWAEGYVDFGWLGVVALLGLVGYFSRRADWAFERQLDRRLAGTALEGPTLAGILVPILAGYELLVLRGSLLEAMGRMITLLVLALWLSKKK
jgi:hypothetical protein